MIIIAVLIGYVLGVAPFLFFYIQNSKSDTKQDGYLKSDNLTTYIDEDTVNEWLYGPKKEEKVSEGSLHYCKKGSSHTFINNSDKENRNTNFFTIDL